MVLEKLVYWFFFCCMVCLIPLLSPMHELYFFHLFSTLCLVKLVLLVHKHKFKAAVLTSEANLKAKACPLYCLDVVYMTCKSSGNEKLNPVCNCCLAPKDCTLHLTDGSSVYCK